MTELQVKEVDTEDAKVVMDSVIEYLNKLQDEGADPFAIVMGCSMALGVSLAQLHVRIPHLDTIRKALPALHYGYFLGKREVESREKPN